MNEEIKGQWLSALRSGEYLQGTGKLNDGEGHYCCLGVLTDLAVKAGVCEWTPKADGILMSVADPDGYLESGVLSEKVAEWAGMPGNVVGRMILEGGERWLTTLNDDGMTFSEIADLIEREF